MTQTVLVSAAGIEHVHEFAIATRDATPDEQRTSPFQGKKMRVAYASGHCLRCGDAVESLRIKREPSEK